MSSGMPELGSKISLISKADIRYEGRLFTVDPQECTIALASVRSFGTEDRETQFPVAPQSQVYDYILFRGSDIKDIRVLNNVPSMPNDPAIMQMSVPPTLGGGQAPPQFGGQFAHPVVGQQQFQQYHPMAGFGGSVQLNKTSELSAVELTQQSMTGPIGSGIVHHGNQVKDQGSMLDLIGGGSQHNASRSNTPGVGVGGHRKSPTADQGTQVGPGAGGSGQQRDSRRGSNPQQKPNNNNQRPRTNSKNRQRYPSGGGMGGPPGPQQPQQPPHQPHHQQNQQPHHQHQPQQNHHQHQNQHHQQNQQPHHQQQQNQIQHPQNQHQQNQLNQLNQQQGAGGFGRGGGGWRGRSRGRGRGFVPRGAGKNTLKFDNDYDFEQANTEFEELRSQLAKAKIGEADAKPDALPIGEVDKKDDSGNETGAGEPEVEDDCTAYDKNKSFFDNISCEAVERSKGRSQRTDWRTERKLNSETFGVASARRGAWRGRGGWRHNPHHQPVNYFSWRPMRGGGGGGPRGGRPLNQPGPHQPRTRPSLPPQPQPAAN